MTDKFEISTFSPCRESIKFRKQFPDFKSAWKNCPRGDWMLWIAQRLKIDLLKLTTAKALCANTVRHLMKDVRSIKALDIAILLGQGKVTKEELNGTYIAYSADAYAAYIDAITNTTNAAAYAAAAYAAYAAYVDDAAYVDASDAAYAATQAVYSDDAKIKNQLQTADICRKILTEVVFEAIDKLTVKDTGVKPVKVRDSKIDSK